MNVEWSRILNTTIPEFFRVSEDNVMRNFVELALLKDRGRITFNHSGKFHDWKVRYKRAPIRGFSDAETLTFPRRDKFKTAQIDWRGYTVTDSVTKMERLKNSGTAAIVNIYSTAAKTLSEDIEEEFGLELYVDGGAGGNGKRIHGTESMFSVSGPSPTGFVGINNDNYAGLSTTLGAYTGAWNPAVGVTGTWPDGTGDSQYDFWTPLVVDYTSVAWDAAVKTWPNTCEEALSYGIIKGQRNRSKKGMLDIIILENQLYFQYKKLQAARQRLNITRGESGDGIYKLGFKDTINHDGCDVTFGYGPPSGVGYGWAIEHAELMSMQPQLFVMQPIDFSISAQSHRMVVDMFGNMKFNPRYFVKFAPITP